MTTTRCSIFIMPEQVVVISFNGHDATFASWHFFTCQTALWVFKKSQDTKFLIVALSQMPQHVLVVLAAQ
jgi:hypothetical protein